MYELLRGLRIIEVSAFVAVPLCDNTLTKPGAEVVLMSTFLEAAR